MMAIFEIEQGGKIFEVEAPDQAAALSAVNVRPMIGEKDAAAHYQAAGMPAPPEGFFANAIDFFKSIPRGAVNAATSLAAQPPSPFVYTDDMMMDMAPTRAAQAEALKAQTHEPQGRAGRFGAAIGEGVANPYSYLGPGSLLLKLGGAALSSIGGEAAGQAAEGTKFEGPARFAGALAGGVAAAKTLGPAAPKAAVPTADELFAAGSQGYKQARNSGLVVHPDAVSSWATRVEQDLIGPDHGFTGGANGVAPKTFGVLATLQQPPAGAVVTAGNLDATRKALGHIAKETQPAGPGGVAKPTADAAAASIALKRLGEFSENLPQGAVLAGDPAAYVRATREANANWGAGERTRDFDARLTKAERTADRQVAGSLDSQIKTKAGQLLDNPAKTKGLTPDELAQLELINSGGPISNTLRQLGRGGAGVVPMVAHLTAGGPLAVTTGGASVPLQMALAATLYGARKGSEAITKHRAQALSDMLAQRSPLFEQRAANLPPADLLPGNAALIRALLGQAIAP